MKNFREYYYTLNEAFEFEGTTKETSYTKNFDQAKVFLRDKKNREVIDALKKGDGPGVGEKTLENILTAIHVAKKVAGNRRLKDEKREAAEELLADAGLDLKSLRDVEEKILDRAEKTFTKRYEEATGEAEEKEEEEEKPEEKEEEEKAEKEEEKEEEEKAEKKEEEEKAEKKEEEEPEKDEDEGMSKEEKERKLTAPKEFIDQLEKYEKDKLKEINDFMEKAPENKKPALTKLKKKFLSRIEKAKNKIEKQRDRYENVPNFQSQLKATTQSKIALNSAKKELETIMNELLSKEIGGALERGVKTAKETGQAIKKKVEDVAKSRGVQKVSQTVGRAAQKGKQAVGRAIEKEAGAPPVEERIKKATGKVKERIKQVGAGAKETAEKAGAAAKSLSQRVKAKKSAIDRSKVIKGYKKKKKEEDEKKAG